MICEGTTQLALNGYRLWCFTLSFVTTQKFYSAKLQLFLIQLNIGQFQLGWEMLNGSLEIFEIKDRKNWDFGRPPFTHICGMLFFILGVFSSVFSQNLSDFVFDFGWNFWHPCLIAWRLPLARMPYFGSCRLRRGRLGVSKWGQGEERRPRMGPHSKVPIYFLRSFHPHPLILFISCITSLLSFLNLSPRCWQAIGHFWLSFGSLDLFAQRGRCSSGLASLTKRTGRKRDGCPCQRTQPLEHKRILNSPSRKKTISHLHLPTINRPKSEEMEILFIRKSTNKMTFSRDGMVFLRWIFNQTNHFCPVSKSCLPLCTVYTALCDAT